MGNDLRTIEGFSNYGITKDGQVWSYNINRFLSPQIVHNGYVQVKMTNDQGERKGMRVHRLVATAFIPNPNNLPEVNHINQVRDDNRVENLEWCDRQYNASYSNIHDKLVKVQGMGVWQCDIKTHHRIKWFPSQNEAARITGVAQASISRCVNNKSNQAGGFCWEKGHYEVQT